MDNHARITNTVAELFASVDSLDWGRAASSMAESIFVDYSSYSGEASAKMPSKDLLDQWAGFLPHFDRIHHQIGNLIIEQQGKDAKVSCHGTAYHYIEMSEAGSVQTVVGTYDFELINDELSWRITSMRFNLKFLFGNPEISNEAKRRASQ